MFYTVLITLSHLQMHLMNYEADKFCKHSDKRRNCSKRAISPFATICFQLFSVIIPTIIEIFHIFQLIFLCRFAVCGKELKVFQFIMHGSKKIGPPIHTWWLSITGIHPFYLRSWAEISNINSCTKFQAGKEKLCKFRFFFVIWTKFQKLSK